jgi:hypothetical protein
MRNSATAFFLMGLIAALVGLSLTGIGAAVAYTIAVVFLLLSAIGFLMRLGGWLPDHVRLRSKR